MSYIFEIDLFDESDKVKFILYGFMDLEWILINKRLTFIEITDICDEITLGANICHLA